MISKILVIAIIGIVFLTMIVAFVESIVRKNENEEDEDYFW